MNLEVMDLKKMMLKKCESKEEVVKEAVLQIIDALNNLNHKEKIVFGLVGGRSVFDIYRELSFSSFDSWHKIHFFMVDERNVPMNSEDSNFNLAKESLFDNLLETNKINEENLHFIDTSLSPDLAVKKYIDELNSLGGFFDLVLLSSGEDNHVGGIFPNLNYPDEKYYYFENSPKKPSERFSATPSLLEKTSTGIVLFLGESKKTALNNFLSTRKTLPEKTINNINNLIIITDQ